MSVVPRRLITINCTPDLIQDQLVARGQIQRVQHQQYRNTREERRLPKTMPSQNTPDERQSVKRIQSRNTQGDRVFRETKPVDTMEDRQLIETTISLNTPEERPLNAL